MMNQGINEIDVHGLRTEQAIIVIADKLHAADSSVYKIRIIHGYNGGTRIKSAIKEEFGYGREDKVKRISEGNNPGITELILREL